MIPPKIRRGEARIRSALERLSELLPVRCRHCSKEVGPHRVTLIRHGEESHLVTFCDADCMAEFLWDTEIKDEIDRQVRKELNWLHKNVCPACKRRLR